MRSLWIRGAWLLAASGCAAFAPRPTFGELPRDLGFAVVRGDCPRSRGELVRAAALQSGAAEATLAPDLRRDFACLSVRDNVVRDEMGECTPPAEFVFATPIPARRRVAADLAYVGLDPREYSYDLVPEVDGALGVEVRIHFKGALGARPERVAVMQQKLADAANLWTRGSPGGRMRFRFFAVAREDNPHYVIDLAEGSPRTPFDLTWGADWPAHLIAHEVGHMMGLDDEYGQLAKTWGHAVGQEAAWRADAAVRLAWLSCDLGSLMCDSKGESARPLLHHYYVIARRRFCRPKPYRWGP